MKHPCFLLHDSPREADLNVRIYERLLEVAAQIMEGAKNGDEIPFQYIVTTTTPPSKRLCKESVNFETLSSGKGSLFGRQLESSSPDSSQKTLFDPERKG